MVNGYKTLSLYTHTRPYPPTSCFISLLLYINMGHDGTDAVRTRPSHVSSHGRLILGWDISFPVVRSGPSGFTFAAEPDGLHHQPKPYLRAFIESVLGQAKTPGGFRKRDV
jgi:hypothetical protein